VSLGQNLIAEKYIMSFQNVSSDGSNYNFELRGATTGDEGAGKTGEDFTSKSGRIRINAADIDLAAVKKTLKKDLPPSFDIEWNVHPMSCDVWRAHPVLENGCVYQDTVVQLWDSGNHVLEVIPNGNGLVGIQNVMIFNPAAQP
jgi:hypothetical protein